MANHPNRSKKNLHDGRNRTPAEVKEARDAAGLTQTEAATLIYTSLRTWQQWEAGDRRMHPAFYELFCIKAKL